MRRFRAIASATAIALACGCALPLDVLGQDETVRQHDDAEAVLADDRIEDKHPVFDPALTIDETFGGCRVTLNKSGSVTKLDVTPFTDADQVLGATIFPTYPAAAGAIAGRPILPTMELVNAALKPFNDGLYAAVELAAEDGSQGSMIAKRAWLEEILTELLARSTTGASAERPLAREAAVTLGAALKLGGGQVPSDIADDAASLITKFNADPFVSRPIGFYGWSPGLSAIFAQDRLLQSQAGLAPSFGAFAATAVALNGKPSLASRYTNVLDLYAGLTNAYFDRSVRDLLPLAPDAASLNNVDAIQRAFATAHPETATADPACSAHLAILPASDSPETRLFRELYCAGRLPPGSNLLDVLVRQIRAGAIDLTPTATSGWYDRQIYALETLLVPDRATEKDHLFLTRRYKEKLVETFKTLLIETRETHAKQLGTFGTATSGEPQKVDVYPNLPVEPFPTFYLRTARAYAFLRALLTTVMGKPFLATAHRVLDGGGASPVILDADLANKITLLYGLHLLSAGSIGMRDELSAEEAAAFPRDGDMKQARAWLDAWRSDSDVAVDPRVILPVARDGERGTATYWAVVGTKIVKAEATFYPGFEPKILGTSCLFRSFIKSEPYLLTGRAVEVTRPLAAPPPTRAEFRALCDRNKTEDAIVRALENP